MHDARSVGRGFRAVYAARNDTVTRLSRMSSLCPRTAAVSAADVAASRRHGWVGECAPSAARARRPRVSRRDACAKVSHGKGEAEDEVSSKRKPFEEGPAGPKPDRQRWPPAESECCIAEGDLRGEAYTASR